MLPISFQLANFCPSHFALIGYNFYKQSLLLSYHAKISISLWNDGQNLWSIFPQNHLIMNFTHITWCCNFSYCKFMALKCILYAFLSKLQILRYSTLGDILYGLILVGLTAAIRGVFCFYDCLIGESRLCDWKCLCWSPRIICIWRPTRATCSSSPWPTEAVRRPGRSQFFSYFLIP